MAGKKKEHLVFEENELAEVQKMSATAPSGIAASKDEIIRNSYRIPCVPEDEAEVGIAGKKFSVINLGSRGLGIRLPHVHDFAAGDLIEKFEFRMGGQRVSLKGRVIHISMEDENTFLCGISLIDLSEDQENILCSLILRRRQQLFTRE
jgi:hypothetical protein